ncbi:Cytochrome p450 [Mycena sanguinolenta]|uniref:Cytochrome p450 n=1 Tax=Mycena sanguinolenta TaxID=230812 RepID=A0A8H7DHB9_9AGAR|nr:Cytochrome p450 [Mycena sanguinolenta]
MSTVYGYDVKPINDHFVDLAETAVKPLNNSVLPGAAAVNVFPILRYLPSWMPGAGFQRTAAECRQLTKQMRELPFEFVKQNMRDGRDSTSVVAKMLESNDRHDEVLIKEVAGASYAAGSDNTVGVLGSFFQAMVLYPDVQKKAQIEIDTIIGTNRLPQFEDRPSLPFVEAVYRELMRWKPVLPLGVPHATAADDVYNGYFIPKGATVVSNIWAMTRDESIYPEPESFKPDRFLTKDGKLTDDGSVLAFGYLLLVPYVARRHNAEDTLWGTIVSVLSTFDIAKAKDAAGNEINVDPSYSDGFLSRPQSFACSITPRSETTKDLPFLKPFFFSMLEKFEGDWLPFVATSLPRFNGANILVE